MFWVLKEPSHCDSSFEYPQHIFSVFVKRRQPAKIATYFAFCANYFDKLVHRFYYKANNLARFMLLQNLEKSLTFWLRNKKNNVQLHTLNWRPVTAIYHMKSGSLHGLTWTYKHEVKLLSFLYKPFDSCRLYFFVIFIEYLTF